MQIGNQNNPVAGASSFTGVTSSSGGGDHAVAAIGAGSTNSSAYLSRIVWSYQTAPTSGGINIYAGSSTAGVITSFDITAAGPDSISFDPLGGVTGTAVTVELLEGGSSVIGKLSIFGSDR